MPRYEYRCVCGARLERVCGMREVTATTSCTRCSGEAHRIFSAPQVSVSSLYSDANRRGLAELDATRHTDERIYARNWNRSASGM